MSYQSGRVIRGIGVGMVLLATALLAVPARAQEAGSIVGTIVSHAA